MRIVLIGPAGSMGGLQTHHKQLSDFLSSEGHTLYVIDVEVDVPAHERMQEFVKYSKVRLGSNRLTKIFRVCDWIAVCLKALVFRPTLYIASSNGFGYALVARALSGINCDSVHMEVTGDYPKHDKVRMAMISAFTYTAVQSPGLRRPILEKLDSSRKVKVLPCFHNIVQQAFAASIASGESEIRLAYFGRLAENKGLEILLNAVAKCCGKFRFSIDVWGKGIMERQLQSQITALNISNVVALRGAYPSGLEYNSLLSTYNGLLVPSQSKEGVPLVILEGASVGLPFLATNIGAIGDCTDDNPDGTIFEVGQENMNSALEAWLVDHMSGKFNPSRTKKWFERQHSRLKQEEVWRKMLEAPSEYWK